MTRVQRMREHLGQIAFGGDYNPEQWPEEIWTEDMRLMKKAGVTMVSVGIFSWAQVEPRAGDFRFGWFDRVMDNLAHNGVAASLATMTASPPSWMATLHPETLPVRQDGTRLWPGGRQHYCPSSPVYREYAARLVERLATRYADHPALALWHIGNEYGCHVPTCYCDVSAEDFRRWLVERYGDIATLNDAWSTAFWSQAYDDFAEILPPRTNPAFANPAQQLDFARFSSDAMLGCYLTEKDVVRSLTPDVPVTTNFLGMSKPVDLFTWAEHVDVVSYDTYPDPHDPQSHVHAAFAYDLMRSLRRGQPWLLMEQAPSAVNWRDRNATKPPGQMRLGSWHTIAHGSDSVLYFQWRQSRGGAEKYHSAMVPHAGEHTRIFTEVVELGQELTRVPCLAGTRSDADVALAMDWSSWWALELDSHPSVDVTQTGANMAHYAPLFDSGVHCDVVHPSWDLSAYRLVVIPNLYMVDGATADNLARYVHQGGTLLLSFFSGIVDRVDRVHLGGYPAPLREMLGLWIEEFWPLPERGTVQVAFGNDRGDPGDAGDGQALADALGDVTGSLWSEHIHPEGAQVLARYASTELAGHPALTRHHYGEGQAWYLSTRLEVTAMRALMDQLREVSGARPVLPDLPEGVRAAVRRADSGETYHLLLNHTPSPASVPLPTPMTDRLSGTEPVRRVDLPPRGVAVLTPAAE